MKVLISRSLYISFRGCAHTIGNANDTQWFSLELEFPQKVSRVQIANRIDLDEGRGDNVRITIGHSKVYDSNEPLCLPEISKLSRAPGLQDYVCTGVLHEGNFVKISREGKMAMNLCEVKVFTLQGKDSRRETQIRTELKTRYIYRFIYRSKTR